MFILNLLCLEQQQAASSVKSRNSCRGFSNLIGPQRLRIAQRGLINYVSTGVETKQGLPNHNQFCDHLVSLIFSNASSQDMSRHTNGIKTMIFKCELSTSVSPVVQLLSYVYIRCLSEPQHTIKAIKLCNKSKADRSIMGG